MQLKVSDIVIHNMLGILISDYRFGVIASHPEFHFRVGVWLL